MDRTLPEAARRADRARRAARVLVPVAGLVAAIALLPGWMRPSLSHARIRTAIVETGPLEAVITASGTVMPEVERVLSSPIDARLVRLLKRPGAAVERGEPVAELDLGEWTLALERIATDLRMTDNEQAQARLALERALDELDARIERQALELRMFEERAEGSRRLADDGLVSAQALREATLAAEQAAIALAQLRRERRAAERSTQLQSEGLSLRRAALDKEAAEARRTLALATTRADRGGVLTWVLSQEGALVRRGDVIARIADLSSFRIDASLSDVHSARLRAGMPVNVVIDAVTLAGSVSNVLPAVDNGILGFTVALLERSHPALRPSRRVDVLVVTDRRARTLKVRQGPFAAGADHAEAFVIREGRAVRTAVQFGLRGFDEVEVLSGLSEGDEVVISDMREYQHLKEVSVR